MIDAMDDIPKPTIFIFVNPTSGGNAASAYMKIGLRKLSFFEEGLKAEVSIYNIRDGKHGNKPGFHDLKECVSSDPSVTESNPVRVLVAGGDGTVMWAISEAELHEVDMRKVSFGVIPYGTGNDFSRCLGWGGSNPSKSIMNKDMKKFKAMLRQYLEADVMDFDLWRVNLKVDDTEGNIKQVKNGEKEVMMEDDMNGKKTLSKPMCNYFSIGIESRIGLGFDKNRTTSTFRNKLRYAIEGFKKMFSKTPRINDVIDECVCDGALLFKTGDTSDQTRLAGSPISLIFLNVNSFAGGCDLWKNATRQGLSPSPSDFPFQAQNLGDHKLEILSYQNLVGLSLEQSKSSVIGGNGCRVGQASGPFVLKFRSDLGPKRTYLQIDGEFFTLDKSESITISHNRIVKVLKKH
jgi:diacylglycerol kinase (ATP)